MLSFCLSNYLAVECEIIVRMAQTIGMKTTAVLKLPVLNRVLLRSYSGHSMGNGISRKNMTIEAKQSEVNL